MSKKNKLYTQSKNPDIPKAIPTHSNGIPIMVWPECVVLYKYVSWDAFEAIMDKWALKACMAHEANDPFEYAPQAKDVFSPVDLSTRVALGSPPPFISFSRSITSAALWGHYAESGKGVCLAFCFPCQKFNKTLDVLTFIDAWEGSSLSKFKNKLNDSNLAKVHYQDERVSTPPIGNVDDILLWYKRLITTKGTTWKHEEEYRLISNYRHADIATNRMLLYTWPMYFLLGVVTGPLCPFSPQYVHKLIATKREAHKAPNFFIEKFGFLGKEIIVSPAKYHWKNFEIEAAPWFDGLHNLNVLESYLQYSAMLDNSDVPLIDVEKQSVSYASPISSWNDFQRTQNQDSQSVTFIARRTGIPPSEYSTQASYIIDLIRARRATITP